MEKKRMFTTVATASMVEANCISRFLNMKGVPTAVERAEGRKLRVVVKSKNEAKAKQLLSTRQRGNCGAIRYR